jgi:peptidoglycan/LPS O-acetylase OafA/YrhL
MVAVQGPPIQQNTTRQAARLGWLDALRGLAALVVVFEHSIDGLFPEVRSTASTWFDFGKYGVFLFFLISGYVVPASLERRGDLRGFWIGRAFRLYPAWLVAAVLGTVFGLAGIYWALPPGIGDHPKGSALAHLVMLQDLLQVPNVMSVFWTLSYEMIFYLLITAMFVAGVHRASAGTSLGLAAVAVGAGSVLPAALLSGRQSSAIVVLLIVGLAAVLSGRRDARLLGVVLLAVPALTLLTVNSRLGAWESLIIIATMFAGTAVYRLERGQLNRRGGWMVALVALLSVLAGVRYADPRLPWVTAIGAAWLTFMLGLVHRDGRVPGPLVKLGVISYSVYLLHLLPLQLLRREVTDPAGLSLAVRLTLEALFLAVVIAIALLSYRFVEQPMQRLGKRLARRGTTPSATRLQAVTVRRARVYTGDTHLVEAVDGEQEPGVPP